jgi:chorismate lyase / 3-hydroxybenzoate synthase
VKPPYETEEDGAPEVTAAPMPSVPAWAEEFVGARFRHVRAGFGGARGMDTLTFQQRVVEAYTAVFEELGAPNPSHPVRFWAFLPGIHDDLGDGLDRYMAFNAGRYRAFAAHFGDPALFSRSVPTATAVGVPSDEFMLHCLAADEPGLPVENPRQISAYHYSRRFGPLPPCFARATIIRGQADECVLLVGGTASIVGEDSRHLADLERQAFETFRNLASVVDCALGGTLREEATTGDLTPLLARFRELRVYYTRSADRAAIAALVKATFSSRCRVEMMPVSLCRPDLLIEIEGLARLRATSDS